MLVYDPNESTGSGAVSDIADGGQRAVRNGGEPGIRVERVRADRFGCAVDRVYIAAGADII